jgi:hypothetical protein
MKLKRKFQFFIMGIENNKNKPIENISVEVNSAASGADRTRTEMSVR